MLKQLKENLNSLEETLKSEHERLTTVLEGIENNKHILDEEGKRIHLNTIEYNKVREEYNRCVEVQEFLDSLKF